MKCARLMLFNLSLCVHFVALRIASLGGWSGGGAVGDVWLRVISCACWDWRGRALGWFSQIAPPGQDSSILLPILCASPFRNTVEFHNTTCGI